jgi:3-dehydroquinate synthase
LLLLECGRDTTIVAVGGGVVGDLAGFVAATFMRGIPVVQVPTTLLSMVDASVGGKTGIDTPYGKNLVGAFHDPGAVLMDVSFLRTLPQPILRSGLAEIIKHGIIADAGYLERVERLLPEIAVTGAAANDLPSIIAGSVRIKAQVVSADSHEGGLRRILNFGHTIAHALERATDYRLNHGDAVAVGMVVESRIAEAMSIAPAGLATRVGDILQRAGLPPTLAAAAQRSGSSFPSPEALAALTRTDKKAASGSVRYALPVKVGAMCEANGQWALPVTEGLVVDALRRS